MTLSSTSTSPRDFLPYHVIAYQGLRKVRDDRTPYAAGDPIRYGWGAIDLGLSGSSHVGIFGGIIDSTNDEKILQLDCLKTDFYHDRAYATYFYCNPYGIEKIVQIDGGSRARSLYDAFSHSFLQENVPHRTSFVLPADSAAVVLVSPGDGEITHEAGKMLIDGVVC